MSKFSLDRECALDLIRRYGLSTGDLVVEVGSGDGGFLQAMQACGVRVLGIEPDMQAMSRAWTEGIDTLAVHFGPGAADYIRAKYGAVKLLVARSVKPGTEEFARLLAGSRCLTADGVIAILSAGVNAVVEVRPDPAHRRAA